MPDTEKARELLEQRWRKVTDAAAGGLLSDALDEAVLRTAVHESVNSPIKTYGYVLPTQILAKLADPSVDCRALQAGYEGPGAFDARTIAHEVVVPFDRDNHRVLGGSKEPYVNNPLRVPAVTERYASPQKNKEGWKHLCLVLDTIERRNSPAFTGTVFSQVLVEIYRRLSGQKLTYPIPIRISHARTIALIAEFLSAQSGGEREQALASALFRLIGQRFGLYDEVRRAPTTAADASTGQVADIECLCGGRAVLAVEVKDRQLTVSQIDDTLQRAKLKGLAEILFIAEKGLDNGARGKLGEYLEERFAKGENVYVLDLSKLLNVCLPLVGEPGRRRLLELVGQELEDWGSDIRHREAWSKLLMTC
jgi:hypothetical protein